MDKRSELKKEKKKFFLGAGLMLSSAFGAVAGGVLCFTPALPVGLAAIVVSTGVATKGSSVIKKSLKKIDDLTR